MKKIITLKTGIVSILALSLLLSSCTKNYNVEVLVTNDVHGTAFSKDFTGQKDILSMSSISYYVDSLRNLKGEDNIFLIDCGDHLQGTVATYYYNYVDSSDNSHLFSRIFNYMDYDAVVVGNHDIEAGHKTYDRLKKELDCPYLAANTPNTYDGTPYFDSYTIIEKNGLKIAVIGFTNANEKTWVASDKYEGMDFNPIYPMAQDLVNEVNEKEKPHVTLLAVHSGLGDVDKDDIENNALFLAANVKGIDAVLASHDHKFMADMIKNGESEVAITEGGSRSRGIARLNIELTVKRGEVISKKIVPSYIKTEGLPSDPGYDEYFRQDYETVKAFTMKPIGRLTEDLDFSYQAEKRSDYMAFVHFIQLMQPGVDVSINAPLTTEGTIKAGDLIYNDLFSLYRFENLLYVVKMKGYEIKDYLEAAFDKRITKSDFMYNYDEAAGLNYKVKSSAPKGKRIVIKSMSDGSRFNPEKTYNVAITSYRASGAGNLLQEAGIDPSEIPSRLVAVYPEIRNLIYQYVLTEKDINPVKIAQNKILGSWKFLK